MTFVLADGEQVRTVLCDVASATVIPAGALAGMTNGLAVDGVAASAGLAWCPKGSADGETTCELTVGNDFTLKGTGDAAFALSQRGTEVDITDAQLIDVGTSTTDVLKIDISENAGTVDATTNIRVRINKPLF